MAKLNLFNIEKKKPSNEKGSALIESIPVLFAIVIIFNFSMGFFGAIHSGILNSIGAYNYSLETFRFRSNLMYFRPGSGPAENYLLSKNRVHGVIQDGNTAIEQRGKWPVTVRPVTFANTPQSDESSHYFKDANNNGIWSVISSYTPSSSLSIETPEIWVKTIYGICITADCK